MEIQYFLKNCKMPHAAHIEGTFGLIRSAIQCNTRYSKCCAKESARGIAKYSYNLSLHEKTSVMNHGCLLCARLNKPIRLLLLITTINIPNSKH